MNIFIDFAKITDWPSFHALFSETMGFPAFYGNNMNAWIDCMSYIDDQVADMSDVKVAKGEDLEIHTFNIAHAFKNCPEIVQEFIECTASVNTRFSTSNVSTRIKIVFSS